MYVVNNYSNIITCDIATIKSQFFLLYFIWYLEISLLLLLN